MWRALSACPSCALRVFRNVEAMEGLLGRAAADRARGEGSVWMVLQQIDLVSLQVYLLFHANLPVQDFFFVMGACILGVLLTVVGLYRMIAWQIWRGAIVGICLVAIYRVLRMGALQPWICWDYFKLIPTGGWIFLMCMSYGILFVLRRRKFSPPKSIGRKAHWELVTHTLGGGAIAEKKWVFKQPKDDAALELEGVGTRALERSLNEMLIASRRNLNVSKDKPIFDQRNLPNGAKNKSFVDPEILAQQEFKTKLEKLDAALQKYLADRKTS